MPLLRLAPFRSLEFANNYCYECPTGNAGFYDAPADYKAYLEMIGVSSPPFANANPAYSEGDGWALVETAPAP
ncbi:hypothetical protein GUITHDRAFT_103358 [Guillardia theta CCMP2712]|uniref:Uncharacterized protein n=1 Tax=Guillardia theta (strain CCMP2712) TaxID=905079 RepID=L1JQR6_GUITC|nr:hypothetical protein GUITHDRAFT_103358 [Guillardia theta CCMP2712]EKX50767.1 hypothetical protein GUITHDRAFT_103358 [Guillardia theta CCMP2712]|eukprot:XP_005837747.1 hypothetical protein GUITHDRAFT_103358 [Guillardia theta CCMP2712]